MTETHTFAVHDYVQYIGRIEQWRGFYLVRSINDDGTAKLHAANGGEISRCPANDIQLLYRPTPEQIAAATNR